MTIQCCGVRLRTTCCSRFRRFLLSFTRYGDSFPRTRLLLVNHNWSCGWRGEQTSIDSYFHALSISDRYFPDAALTAAFAKTSCKERRFRAIRLLQALVSWRRIGIDSDDAVVQVFDRPIPLVH